MVREIFRAYDIRGVYPTELGENDAEEIGISLGIVFNSKNIKTVVVGCDDRPSSYSMVNKLISGLLSQGITVINTGITVQPAIHYFTYLEGISAGINVTASHNPGSYNGIKIDLKNAVPFFGDDLIKLYELTVSRKGKTTLSAAKIGDYREEDLNPKYIDYVSSKFKLKHPTKVAVYCGNGATSNIYPQVLEKIGAHVVPLRCYLDSEFPAGVPNPESENFYKELKGTVLESHAHLGVGFDSDGDRVGEVDEKGNFYRADQIFLLYIKEFLAKNPGETVVYDVKCSQLVENYIKQRGGVPKMIRTGRAYVLDEIENHNVKLACELSGHMYFKDEYFGYDDGIYAACRLLRILDESGQKLSELMSEFPQSVATPEIKVNCPDDKKFEIVKKITDSVVHEKKYLHVDTTDGVRVKVSSTEWFLIRASNTNPYLSIRAEADTKENLNDILKEIGKILSCYSILKL